MKTGGWRRVGWLILAWTMVIVICLVTAIWIVNSIDHKNNDYISFHLAGYMVVHGEDPYYPEQWVVGHEKFDVTWISDQTFIYPLPLALVFVPLSLLPLYESYIAWTALSMGMILVSLYILLRLEHKTYNWLLLLCLFAGSFLFRPTILTLVNGQLTAFLLLVLVGSLHLWNKGKWEYGAMLLSLLILKPNLGAPITLLLVAWLLMTKKSKSILGLLLGGVILLLIGLIMNPAWVQEYLAIGGGKVLDTFGFSPTIWGLASLVCDFRSPCSLVLGGAIALPLVLMVDWLFVKGRVQTPIALISMAITTALLLTPYSWTYDQLLLMIPITTIAFFLLEHKKGFLLAVLLFPGMALLGLFVLLPDHLLGIEILNAFIPLLVFLLLAYSLPGKHKKGDGQADTAVGPKARPTK